ncbi:hypothetical protein [Streptomyces sp. NPDC059708]|uniref:hypothetical protein n=1 Tax=Streptomyces sp. NPDC059708 TaxID=3346916 RepID=UPI0036D1911A
MTAYPLTAEIPGTSHRHAANCGPDGQIAHTACRRTGARVSDGRHLPECPACATALANLCDNPAAHPSHRRNGQICPGVVAYLEHGR